MSDIGIKELAAFTGVSIASVSRALHKPERVSKAMRARVEAAAKELGYRPNRIGASLRTSRSGNIIAIIPDISDTFTSGLIQSLEHTAGKRGYFVLFGDTNGSRERELAYAGMVRTRQADGIIVFSHLLPFTDEEVLDEKFTMPPIVSSCELITPVNNAVLPFVSIDNIAAGKDLTEYLLRLGHRKIAVITGDIETSSTKQRLEGYRQALKDAGIDYDEALVFKGEYTLEAGVTVTHDILRSKVSPTAIFCMCDETAIGCVSTLKEQGYRVPEQISVAGFDDIRFAKHQSPSLTTVSQPVAEIGATCANTLIDIIEGLTPPRTDIILPHAVVPRASTRAID